MTNNEKLSKLQLLSPFKIITPAAMTLSLLLSFSVVHSQENITSNTIVMDVVSDKVVTDDVVSDDVVSDDVVSDDVVSDDVVSDDVVSDDVVSDDVVSDDVVSDDVVSDDVVSDNVVSDNVVSDNVVSDNVVSDKVVADEANKVKQAADVTQDSVTKLTTEQSTENAAEIQSLTETTNTKTVSIAVNCDDICRDSETGLPMKILARAYSNIYEANNADKIVFENVPTFKPFYVRNKVDIDLSDAKNPQGWYLVSDAAKSEPIGWMQTKDVVEWHQALIMAYTHPGEIGEDQRKRVLMFNEYDGLKSLVENDNRADSSETVYKQINDGQVPVGIIGKEPNGFVDIVDNFYILPIIDYEQMNVEGDDTTLLRIAAAVPDERGAQGEIDTSSPEDDAEKFKNINVDIVFVMDMTASMQPYIDATKASIKSLSERLINSEDETLKDRLRFGLVGYRDSTELAPGLEFASKNFTPELLSSDALATVLNDEAAAAKVSSVGYAEDVFAGVYTAVSDSAWREDSLKIMVLIGDSSGHRPGEQGATTEQGSESLKQLANDRGIQVIAVHLNDQEHIEDATQAVKQYSAVSKVKGNEGESAFISINSTEKNAFAPFSDTLGEQIDGYLTELESTATVTQSVSDDAETTEQQTKKVFKQAFNAGFVELLGKDTSPPRDVTAWVWDRDLTDPTVKALDVRLMIDKNQLNDFAQQLKEIRAATLRAEITQADFFDTLRSISTSVSKEQLKNASMIKDAGLLPAFIESLPYKSNILTLSNAQFSSMSAEDRSNLDNSLTQKIAHYEAIASSDKGWILLNESADLSEQVYPLSLEMLP